MSLGGKMSSGLVRALSIRSFSAQAKPAQSAAGHAGIVSTVLPNKIFVATCDNGATSARVSVAYKAGSRYEPNDAPGLSHVLRIAAGLTTEKTSTFAITRNLQEFGANLTATVDRETIVYTLEATKAHLEDAIKFLNDVATNKNFFPWEVSDNLIRAKYEIANLAPEVRAMDLLHKAAYRRGLGNSLFCPPRQMGKIAPETLQHFVNENFLAGRCAVAAYGISLDRAVAAAQTLNLSEGAGAPLTPSPYKGGEMRKEMGGEIANVALAVEGVALGSKESLALAVLARAIGSGPQVKWGNDNSPLAKGISTAAPGSPFAGVGFNLSYSDSGLFGILLSAPVDAAGKVTAAAGQLLKKGISSLGGDALKRGRARLITEVLSVGDSGTELTENLSIQGVLTGSVKSAKEIAEEISRISDSDISNVASKISQGKVSIGAAGALRNVPYADEL